MVIVQSVPVVSVATSNVSISFPVLPTVGNTVIVLLGFETPVAAPSPTVSDNQSGNSYAVDVQQASGNNGFDYALIASSQVVGSSGTFTVSVALNVTGVNAFASVGMIEVSGLTATSWLDQIGGNNGGTGANAANVTAAGAISQASELVVAVMAIGGSSATMGISVPTSYTEVWVQQNGATLESGEGAYQVVSSIGTPSAAWNHLTAFTGYGWAAALATYKAVSAPGGRIFIRSNLSGLQAGGPLFVNPLG